MCENVRGEHGLHPTFVPECEGQEPESSTPAAQPSKQELRAQIWTSRDGGQYEEYVFTGGE